METVWNILFGAMVLERILGSYVGCYQDTVWDIWDCPDYYMDGEDYLDLDSSDYFLDFMKFSHLGKKSKMGNMLSLV